MNDKRFYPDYLFEITVVILLTLGLVLILSLLFPPVMGRKIDFLAQFQPMPEWYFLWLYQMIKYFPGNWAFVGAVLIPAAMFLAILFAPLLDRSPMLSIRKRPAAAIAGAIILIAVILLTLLSY